MTRQSPSQSTLTFLNIREQGAAGIRQEALFTPCGIRFISHQAQSTRVSSHNSPYGSSILDRQEIYGREHDDPMNDLDVNMAIWGIFLNATLRAAVHLGQEYEANLRYVRNNLWNSVGQLFRETGKLISEHREITGKSTIDFKAAAWMSTSLLCEKRRIGSPTPKLTSAPTLCSVW